MTRKITLDEYRFRRTGLAVGRFKKTRIMHIANRDIAWWLWYWENLPVRSHAIGLFRGDYHKLLRERSIRKLTRSYTISNITYFKYPRNLGGRSVCRST